MISMQIPDNKMVLWDAQSLPMMRQLLKALP